MTLAAVVLVTVSELSAVAGQVLLKHAINLRESGEADTKAVPMFAFAIAAMTLSFFVWLALMSSFDLSYLYPFDGLDRVVLVAAAVLFLKEKVTPDILLGVALICAGVLLVAGS